MLKTSQMAHLAQTEGFSQPSPDMAMEFHPRSLNEEKIQVTWKHTLLEVWKCGSTSLCNQSHHNKLAMY